jgi:hypothetical protein
VRRLVLVLASSMALVACSTTYHPEYHPESSYKYVQNVLYAQNVVVRPEPSGETAPIDLEMAAPYLNLWSGGGSGQAPPAPVPTPGAPHGKVSSPGGVVIYGDVYGDMFFGR